MKVMTNYTVESSTAATNTNSTEWAKKARPQTHGPNSVNPNQFTKFFTGRFTGKFALNWLLKIPPLFAYVATLPVSLQSVI